MKYRIRKVYSLIYFADVEADSFEEAKKLFEDERELEWEEEDGGKPCLESIDYYEFQPWEDAEDEDDGDWEQIYDE